MKIRNRWEGIIETRKNVGNAKDRLLVMCLFSACRIIWKLCREETFIAVL